MKRKYLILFSLLIAVCMLTGTVHALFRDITDEKSNVFILTHQSSELVEVVYEMRGAVLHKEPFAINTGSSPCLVRVKVMIDPEELCDSTVTSSPSEEEKESLLENGYKFWIDFQSSWKYHDGYWYYQGVLNPGEETPPVFRTINWLNIDEDGNWMNYQDFDIYIYKESVFAEGVCETGGMITALNSDGSYNDENAQKIWGIYTQ